jgi:glycosyltransferase involved in cell wall biosynthesis
MARQGAAMQGSSPPSERPLVSVLTPTWQRPELLVGAIENVRAQTYRPLEHVIISDGPDTELVDLVELAYAEQYSRYPDDHWLRYGVYELGRNWSSFLPDSFCAAPTTVAMLVASGDYQTWLVDDERMEPDHIESLVTALEASGADFAYSKVELWWENGSRRVIGTDPPSLGEITNCLYRTELLRLGLYPFEAGMISDWRCISRWQSRGARHAFVDRVTLTHRVDH